jgi:uncharacterized phage-associated protein
MINTKTIVDVIYYILSKIKKADKLKIIKLIYLADKYHLVKYGRTITEDDYYAMRLGPVATTAKDVLSFDKELMPEEYKYITALIKQSGDYNFEANSAYKGELDTLSETDIESLDYVIKKFEKMDKSELIEYTHRYPEWKQYESLFTNGKTKRERINTKDMLSLIESDSDLNIDKKHLEETKKLLDGTFD